MIRAHVQSIAVALATFSVVSGGIVGVGLLTSSPVAAEARAGVAAIRAAPDMRPLALRPPVDVARASAPRIRG